MKKILISLLILTMLFSLAACGKDDDTVTDGDNTVASQADGAQNEDVGDDTSDAAFEYTGNYLDDHLNGDYSITYKMMSGETGGETTEFELKMIHTSEGYYTMMSEGAETLYIKNGDNYDLYEGDSENGFTYIEGMSMTEDDVKSYTQAFLGYMSAYEEIEDSLKKSGSVTIAGRDCDKYYYEDSALGSKIKTEYCIDKETGICMKYFVEGSSFGEGGSYQFECTELLTSGVSLPSYN